MSRDRVTNKLETILASEISRFGEIDGEGESCIFEMVVKYDR